MKQYRVIVNGTEYEVAVECLGEKEIKAAPTPSVPTPTPAPVSTGNGEVMKAPMPGTILQVHVQNGSAVKKGQVVFILEAMKMENEIFAPCDGVVSGLSVKEGESVQTGAQLCVIA